jgi:hypothetical protein
MDRILIRDITPQALETIVNAYQAHFSITASLPSAKSISEDVHHGKGHSCELTPDPFGHPDNKLVFTLYSEGIGVSVVPNGSVDGPAAALAFYQRLEKDIHHAQDLYRKTKGLLDRTKEVLAPSRRAQDSYRRAKGGPTTQEQSAPTVGNHALQPEESISLIVNVPGNNYDDPLLRAIDDKAMMQGVMIDTIRAFDRCKRITAIDGQAVTLTDLILTGQHEVERISLIYKTAQGMREKDYAKKEFFAAYLPQERQP